MPGDGCRLDRRDLRTAAERPRPEPRCPRGLCPDLRAGPPNRPARLPPVRAGYGGRRALPRRGRFRRRPTGRTARDFLRAAVTPAGPGRLRDLSPPPDAAGEIGRASCRERVWMAVGAVASKGSELATQIW